MRLTVLLSQVSSPSPSTAKTESEMEFIIVRDEFSDDEEDEEPAAKSSRSIKSQKSTKSHKSVASSVATVETETDSVSDGLDMGVVVLFGV